MNSKIFSYKVEGILLGVEKDNLKTSPNFDRKAIIEQLKTLFASDNFKPDERTLSFKIKDGQLFIEGLATETEAPKTIGFFSGK
ncbi:hypothetical protein A0256_03870 [Mucilaginibacter sp. PAMC 26640]|nr:hypothetical protein A0256_03870 [Mucilaginibacter sp. PAMC 26640]